MSSRKEKIIQMYFEDEMKPADIVRQLDISKSAVTQVLQRDIRYELEKENRKEINKEIHKQKTKEYIKGIQFNHRVDDLILKRLHEQASMELSQGGRLSNMAYRNWNTSAYKYNEKRKGFEFREELGRSYYVAKFIKVRILR